MIKGFKIRIYPTKDQEQLMWKHIGCCRYIWNYMLELQEARHKNGEKHLSGFDMIRLITPLKRDGNHDWLYEVSNTSLQISCMDLHNAYEKMFSNLCNVPKFKSRKTKDQKYPVNHLEMYFLEDSVYIQKIGKIKYKTDFIFPIGRKKTKFLNARIFYKNSKWMLSFSMECESQAQTLTDKTMGIDLGIKDLAIAELDGEKIIFHNINKSRKMRYLKTQLAHINRSISRKYETNKRGNKYIKTNNIKREEDKLRKLYQKITNIRYNYIHQATHDLISRLPKKVVMEDLSVKDMQKDKHLSPYIQEQCFYEFIRQMKYKCEWNGIEFVQADRYYPSSKTCSNCGHVKKDLRLKDRKYVCSECGFVIDRDYNAAINLSRYTG